MKSKLFAFYLQATAQGKDVLYKLSPVVKMEYNKSTDVLKVTRRADGMIYCFSNNDLIDGPLQDFHCPLDDFTVTESIYDKIMGF